MPDAPECRGRSRQDLISLYFLQLKSLTLAQSPAGGNGKHRLFQKRGPWEYRSYWFQCWGGGKGSEVCPAKAHNNLGAAQLESFCLPGFLLPLFFISF